MNTIEEWNDVLQHGFPKDEQVLQQMPFGFAMLEAYNKKDPNKDPDDPSKSRYLHRHHLVKIVEEMNSLLGDDIRRVIRDGDLKESAFIVGEWVDAWRKIHGDNMAIDKQNQSIWRLEAFLHDVGKSLTHSKHPTRGQYLVTRLKPDERDRLVKAIGSDRFNQTEKVIAFHDRFGVISTGEASFGILADAVDRGTENGGIAKSAQTISHIMVLNLIDIGASVKWGLISSKVKVVLDDWKHACWNADSPLDASQGDRGQFEERLLELAAKDQYTIHRIARLLGEAYRRARGECSEQNDFNESYWPSPETIDFTSAARQALQACAGIDWDEFKVDFAHVVKMDYLLYFADKVAKEHWTRYGDPNKLAVCIVSVIQKLIKQFADLIRRREKMCRIGIDLSVLRDTPEVQRQIALLLSSDHTNATYGLEWLTHEAGAWPF